MDWRRGLWFFGGEAGPTAYRASLRSTERRELLVARGVGAVVSVVAARGVDGESGAKLELGERGGV